MKNAAFLVMMASLIVGCGTDKPLLQKTKFDAGLREKVEMLAAADTTVDLLVEGKCNAAINGLMRQDLVDRGAEVQVMKGDTFTALISSDDLFDIASLEFVDHLKLLKK